MPKKNFKSITVSQTTFNRLNLPKISANYQLALALEEREKLQKFALKITKLPGTVRVYTIPNLESRE
ncbi:MAG: hypothetical protein V3U87_15895 [Methylococcaceae bacterium]